MMIPQNKNERQLVWLLQYVETPVDGSELYCYSTEDNRNSVTSQTSYRMDVTRLEKIRHGEAGGIWRLPHRWQGIVDALGDYFEGQLVRTSTVFFQSLVCVVISDK